MLRIYMDCITEMLKCPFCSKTQCNTPTSFCDCEEKFEDGIQRQLKLKSKPCDFFFFLRYVKK